VDRSRVSACSIPLREQSLDHALRVIAESGFRKVDLLARMPHFSVTDPDYDLAELERLCDVHGVRIANIGAYCGREACSLDAAVRAAAMEEMNLTFAAARRLGSRTVRVAPGSGRREEIDTLVPFFQAAAEIAERDQIWLGIENHGTEISGDPDACLEICEKVGSDHFGILYEPCNLMATDVDYKTAFHVFKDHIVHVHIKDGAPNAEGKWERCMLGDGEIDVRWVYEQVEALGYSGDYALEFEVGNIEPAETGYPKWFRYWKEL
jgi:sugar phosphate isomerase/epimerase|tara:strand:- start:824 stop:1618 length:795 start_codon:yes stop_codon:yes gene_type:complete